LGRDQRGDPQNYLDVQKFLMGWINLIAFVEWLGISGVKEKVKRVGTS
jgi:hypothetical protein